MKFIFTQIKNRLVPFAAMALLSGCVDGPIYPWVQCSNNRPYMPGCYYTDCCTAYRPNSFYRCQNHHCTTYSPYAPNKCDPYPYYTGCKYTGCRQGTWTTYP